MHWPLKKSVPLYFAHTVLFVSPCRCSPTRVSAPWTLSVEWSALRRSAWSPPRWPRHVPPRVPLPSPAGLLHSFRWTTVWTTTPWPPSRLAIIRKICFSLKVRLLLISVLKAQPTSKPSGICKAVLCRSQYCDPFCHSQCHSLCH